MIYDLITQWLWLFSTLPKLMTPNSSLDLIVILLYTLIKKFHDPKVFFSEWSLLLLIQNNVREPCSYLHIMLSTLCQRYDYFKYLSCHGPLKKVHLGENVETEGLLTAHSCISCAQLIAFFRWGQPVVRKSICNFPWSKNGGSSMA